MAEVDITAATRTEAGFPNHRFFDLDIMLGDQKFAVTHMLSDNPDAAEVFQCLAACAKSFERAFKAKGLM